MESIGRSGLTVGPAMKRKRTWISRRPRANSDALFHSYFGLPSLVETFGKHDEHESLRITTVASDGLRTENKLKKLKLKFGGVTHTIHTKSKTGLVFSGRSFVANFSSCSDDPQLQDDSDGTHANLSDKRKDLDDQSQKSSSTDYDFTAEDHLCRGKTFGESIIVKNESVRKSKRIPKKRHLDIGFSDEENEDAELQYLERLNDSKISVTHNKDNQEIRKRHSAFKVTETSLVDHYKTVSGKDGKGKLKLKKKYDDQDYVEEEDSTSDDGSISERKKPKEGSLDFLMNHSQSVDSCKDLLSVSDVSIINVSDGLIPTSSQRKKGKLSETEQQLKKAEAAQRRKMQSEKAAREAEAEAIRKILGHDPGRKKKEEKMKKQLEEKYTKSLNLGSNTVRWNMGPNGTVVTFSEDIGLPSIFQMVPNRYPPPREKCAGPNCSNVYKYRDSKSKLPLCSLNCYRAIQEKMQPLIAC